MAAPLDTSNRSKPEAVTHHVGAFSRIVSSPAWCIVIALGSAACAAEAGDGGDTVDVSVAPGDAHLAIYDGVEDNDDSSLSGVVALRVGTGGTFELCSGALVAPNLVLTARHCVTKNVTTSVSCDENGRSANGKHISAEEDPTTIGIYTGAAPSFGRAPQAKGRAIISPKGAYLCDSDIALVILDQAVEGAKPLAVRLKSPAHPGETIRSVGYGQNDQDTPIGTRFRKTGVKVLAQGRGVSASNTPLGTHEFEVGRSICQGDSGGPAVSEETQAIIGVVSRGSGCEDDFGHIYTTTAGFDALFDEAFAIAGAVPTLEASDSESTNSSTRAQSTDPNLSGKSDQASSSGSCAMASGKTTPGSSFPALLVAACAALVARVRRRR